MNDHYIRKGSHLAGLVIIISVLFVLCPASSHAQTQTFSGDTSRSTEGLGNFIGEFTYRLFSPTAAELDVTLRNTSAQSNGGFLTGFIFNNPNNFITDVSLSGSNSFFALLGGPSFQSQIKASPFSNFDIGAAVGGDWLGGGKPTVGIPVGGTASFSFGLTGNNLNQLNTNSFVQATSSEGDFFISRFKGFNDGGSDKVPASPATGVPEPDTIFLLGAGLVGIAIFNGKGLKARLKKSDKKLAHP